MGQVLGGDQAAGSGPGQRAVSAIYLQTAAGSLYSPATRLSVCLSVCSLQPSGSFSYRLDGEMGDVHQLVPLQRHRPHVCSQHQVLHWEGGQVLDLPGQGETAWKIKDAAKVEDPLSDLVFIRSAKTDAVLLDIRHIWKWQ